MLLALVLSNPWISVSQVRKFSHLSVDEGLSQNSVLAICQDSIGYLWFGTANGLNRYDGQQLEVFFHDDRNENSLPDNFINTIWAEKHRIWIGTRRGLCYRDYEKGKIFRADNLFPAGADNSDFDFWHIAGDRNGNLWLLGEQNGFHIFRKGVHEKSFQKLFFLPPDPSINTSNIYGKIIEDSSGNIWIGTSKSGLWAIPKKTGRIEPVKFFPGKGQSSVTALVEDSEKNLWVGTIREGLYRTSYPNSSFQRVEGLKDEAIRCLYLDRQSNVLVGTDKGGLHVIMKGAGRILIYDYENGNHETLRHNSVWSIFQDNQDILWVGTYAGGVSYHDPNIPRFFNFSEGQDLKKNLSNNTITGFAEDQDRKLWVATDRGGLNMLDQKTGLITQFRHSEKNRQGLNSDVLTHLLISSQDQFWIGTWLGGLNLFDRKTRKFYYYLPEKDTESSLGSSTVNFILEDKSRNLWLATSSGVDFVNGKTLKEKMPPVLSFTHFKNHPADPSSLSGPEARVIYQDSQENIWIGTNKGLNLFVSRYQNFKNHRNNPDRMPVFTEDNVLCILSRKNGDMLIGSADRGLLYYKRKENQLEYMNETRAFPANTIFGIVEERDGVYWISTNTGLYKFMPDLRNYLHYSKYDGIPSNEFKNNAYLRLSTGELAFGGIKGFTLFHPDSIKNNIHPPVVVLKGIRLANQLLLPGDDSPLKQDIAVTREIKLEHDQSFLSLEFTALNFSIPEKVAYAYKMEGLDQSWNYVGNQRIANYSYVPPGSYTFRVKAANNTGIWNTQEAVLKIDVAPPWWETLWFKTAIGAAMIGGVFLIIRLRTKRLVERKRELRNLVNIRTAELALKNDLLSDRQEEILQQKEEILAQKEILEKQFRTIRTLSHFGQQITSSIRKDEFLHTLFDVVGSLMDVKLLSIGRINTQKQSLDFLTLESSDGDVTERVVFLDDKRFSILSITQNKELLITNLENEAEKYGFSNTYAPSATRFRSAIYLPLNPGSEGTNGIVIIKSDQYNAYGESEFDALRNLAAYISIALENATVFREMESQSALLSSQSDRLQMLDKLKTDFFINISHEFRTPLTLILSPLQKILSDDSPTDRAIGRKQLEMMNKNAVKLLSLVEELLDIRHLESGNQVMIPVKLDAVSHIKGVLRQFEQLAEQHKIRINFHCSEEFTIYADPGMLEKIFTNLYSNAFKYTPAGGTITTRIKRFECEGLRDCLEINIEDTGRGISADELPYIFERFYQGELPLNNVQRSSGIGLSLVKDLVELHSGTIKAESVKGRGTRFLITLPSRLENAPAEEVKVPKNIPDFLKLAEPRSKPEFIEQHLAGNPFSKKILLAEDNEDLVAWLSTELSDEFTVLQALDGSRAFELAVTEIPDLIVSDVMMPGIDGLALCSMLRADQRTSHIPVIMLTAKTGENAIISGLETGADDYVQKPFNFAVLKARIRNLLETRAKLHEALSKASPSETESVLPNDPDKNFISELNRAINSELKNPELNHEFLCRSIGMSKTQLYRKLHAITGQSVHQYIRNVRLNHARDVLIKQPTKLIFEVAFECGFKDPAYFSRCFHALFSIWPKDLRECQPNEKLP